MTSQVWPLTSEPPREAYLAGRRVLVSILIEGLGRALPDGWSPLHLPEACLRENSLLWSCPKVPLQGAQRSQK